MEGYHDAANSMCRLGAAVVLRSACTPAAVTFAVQLLTACVAVHTLVLRLDLSESCTVITQQ